MKDDVQRMGESSPFTQLVWPLANDDPDDAFSSVPYEKGFCLLFYLESLVGTPAFEEFAKHYINSFKFSSVTSGDFRDCFIKFFDGNPTIKTLSWDDLFYSRGMPVVIPDFSNTLASAAEELGAFWVKAERLQVPDSAPVSTTAFDSWSTNQKNMFLECLLEHVSSGLLLSNALLQKLDSVYSLTSSQNSEIMFRWQSVCLKCGVEWIVPHVVRFITSQGRMKFVRPLYRALAATSGGREIAVDTFVASNKIYHPIARKMVAQDLGLELD